MRTIHGIGNVSFQGEEDITSARSMPIEIAREPEW